MKQITQIRTLYTLALVATLALFSSCGSAQKVTATPAEINSAIQSGQWRFNADRALPQSGSSRQLTTQYWVELRNNKASFELPYFGRAQGSIGMPGGSKGPLEFSTTDYSLTKSQKGEGGWLLTLKPKDNNDVVSATFTFFENGNATLDVILTNRSPISFGGYVEPAK